VVGEYAEDVGEAIKDVLTCSPKTDPVVMLV